MMAVEKEKRRKKKDTQQEKMDKSALQYVSGPFPGQNVTMTLCIFSGLRMARMRAVGRPNEKMRKKIGKAQKVSEVAKCLHLF